MKKIGNWNKQIALSAALCASGVVGTAQAISQGEPGEALLIPYVHYDSSDSSAVINTLIGITVPLELGESPVQHEINDKLKGESGFTTVNNEESGPCDLTDPTLDTETIHWWFFNDTGTVQHNGTLNTGCDDWAALDWRTVVEASGNSALDGMLGYMVIANHGASDGSSPEYAMYADVILIKGNWGTAAYLPAVPMTDEDDGQDYRQGIDEVQYTGGVPTSYSPLTAGMGLDDDDGSTSNDAAVFNMRYFLDPSLSGSTEMVVWLDQNCRGGADGCDRRNVTVTTLDTSRTSVAGTVDLSKMLNVVDPATLARPGNATSGYIIVSMPEASDSMAAGRGGPDHAGVAFSLIHFTASDAGSKEQIQSILAHEQGVE